MKGMTFTVALLALVSCGGQQENPGACVLSAATTSVSAAAAEWQPPLGVPDPGWGITDASPDPTTKCASWPSAVSEGCFYIDPQSPLADDAENPNGYPGKPRLTIPVSGLGCGSYVEIHGTLSQSMANSGRVDLTCTAGNEIWFRGQDNEANRPTLTSTWEISGAYLRFENLRWKGDGIRVIINGSYDANRIGFRNIEIDGNAAETSNDGFAVGVYSGISATHSNIVVYKAFIHHTGNANSTASDPDAHCFSVHRNSNNVWLLDSELAFCGGDGVQIEAGHALGSGATHHIYVGRNRSHDHFQTGFWVKHASDVIVSQNEVYNIDASSSQPGGCLGYQYGPTNLWFLFNRLHNCNMGVFAGSGDGDALGNVYVVGNLMYDIDDPEDPSHTTVYDRNSANRYYFNNTMCGDNGGFSSSSGGSGKFEIRNNIVACRTENSEYEIVLSNSSVADSSLANYNLLSAAAGMRANWGGASYGSVPFAGQCANCLTSDPLFTNRTAKDFTLQAGSPARDAGVDPSTVANNPYSIFQSRYGRSIAYDLTGTARPQNSRWDIGAFEMQ